MTGADHFQQLLARAEQIAGGVPPEHRQHVMMSFMQGATIGLAAQLLGQHDYGAAHDVVLLGAQTTTQMGVSLMQEHPEWNDLWQRSVARLAGADVPLIDEKPSLPSSNALSADELEALGIGGDRRAHALGETMDESEHSNVLDYTYFPIVDRCQHTNGCEHTPSTAVVFDTEEQGLMIAFLRPQHFDAFNAGSTPADEPSPCS